MRSSTPLWLVVIAAITLLAVWMVATNPTIGDRQITTRYGLDIQGGLRVLLATDPGADIDAGKLDQARQIVDRRVNALGVVEPVVQVSGNNRIVVELPGLRDPQAAIASIKQTGLLEFVDFSKTGACTASMPAAGQFVLTDRQVVSRGAQPIQPAATANATANATLQATTSATAAPTTAPAVAPTSAPTADSTRAVIMDDANFKPAVAQATADATQQVTAQANTTAQATVQATQQATVQSTVQATAAATGAVTPAAALPPDGSSKDRAALNPCTGQPFNTIMTGAGLQNAEPRVGGSAQNQWVVSFTLADNDEGKKFGPFTATHIQQPMAIVLDGQVLSAPTIQSALTTGGEITGGFDQARAKDLALQLRYGALPIPLHVESTEQVGASLGAESVAATGRAGILGVAVVLVFMIVYYRVPGLMAALALLLFAAINFALYKFIPITLTLPAITGFLISIGTAVDGNILIFERVKEELRLGRPLDKAIETGFARAWPSIRDSNISTIMVGLILYFFGGTFGAGSVRGFAITLILGLLTNLFTAVIVTRTLLNVALTVVGDALRRNKWMIGL